MGDAQRAIEAWGDGKFLPLVMFAQTVASSASECHAVLQRCRDSIGPWLLASGHCGEIGVEA